MYNPYIYLWISVYLPCLSTTQRKWNEATMRQHFGSLFGSWMRMRLRLRIGNGMRSWRGNRWDKGWESERERKWALAAFQRHQRTRRLLFICCCWSLLSRAAQPGGLKYKQGSQLRSDPFSISRRLPRRSFNKVCRRLGIKISCELALIFYLFVFALWLSVFCSTFLAFPGIILPFSWPLFALVFVAGYY